MENSVVRDTMNGRANTETSILMPNDGDGFNGAAVHITENPLDHDSENKSRERLPNGAEQGGPRRADEVEILMPDERRAGFFRTLRSALGASTSTPTSIARPHRLPRRTSLERLLILVSIFLFIACMTILWVAIFRRSGTKLLAGNNFGIAYA
jgi:hypothetical protein